MSYLVTGGTGLLGARIVRDLIRDGEQVVAYDLFPDRDMMDMLLSEHEKAKVKIVQGDVLDFSYLMNTLKENNVDSIVHTAAIIGKDAINANIPLATRVGTEGTVNIFEAARLLGLKKVVWTSSNAVFAGQYGGKSVPNDAPHNPWGIYGASKSFGEHAADYYFQEFGVDITALRYGGLIFGAGQERGNSGAIMRELVLNPSLGKKGRVPFGDDTLAWIYVDDAARAAVLACKHHRVKTGSFNIAGHMCSMRELVDYVKALIPDADIEVLPGSIEFPPWRLDMAATKKELGYQPQWSVKDGIKETINMMRQRHALPAV